MICLFSDHWHPQHSAWTSERCDCPSDPHICQHILLTQLGMSFLVWPTPRMPACLGHQLLPGTWAQLSHWSPQVHSFWIARMVSYTHARAYGPVASQFT
jgi:hypothetical protein